MIMDLPGLGTLSSSLESAGDRVREAHFFLHGMERFYHFAEPFRWHLNAFLRPLKEVSQVVEMAIQSDPEVVEWHRDRRADLRSDELVAFLGKQRDIVVHQGMIIPSSSALIGVAEGRGMKLGIGVSVSPRLDSDVAMAQFGKQLSEVGDPFGFLDTSDEDSLPAVEREWTLTRFPESELVGLCAEAWLRTAEYLWDVLEWASIEAPKPDLSCRHGREGFRRRLYSREALVQGEVNSC